MRAHTKNKTLPKQEQNKSHDVLNLMSSSSNAIKIENEIIIHTKNRKGIIEKFKISRLYFSIFFISFSCHFILKE